MDVWMDGWIFTSTINFKELRVQYNKMIIIQRLISYQSKAQLVILRSILQEGKCICMQNKVSHVAQISSAQVQVISVFCHHQSFIQQPENKTATIFLKIVVKIKLEEAKFQNRGGGALKSQGFMGFAPKTMLW